MQETVSSNRAAPFCSELVRAHSYAALATLIISAVFGIMVAALFVYPDLTAGSEVATWGRLRYAHTQGIMIGWLGNAFLAFLYYAVPVLTGRAVSNITLGWVIFGLWNFVAVIPGWVLVLSGVSQPLEWAEFPLIVDAVVICALLLSAVQFLPAFFRQGLDSLYVSSWYIIGGLVFTVLAYPTGNIVPDIAAGASSAAFGGLWIHNAVGLFVTPLALAIVYYVIPASTGRPIYSHFLSMLGFWGLFFFYPLNGTHHYIFSVIPMAAQLGAIAASAFLGLVVLIVVSNLTLSMRGAGLIAKDPALRFIAASVLFYFIVSMQGASQAQMSLNQFVHFSDWVVGHSHLAMLGFATFAAIGGIVHVWQRMPNSRYNPRAIEWSFWLLFIGISLMVIDLTVAGIVQAELWQQAGPWIESVRASKPYWMLRYLSAIPVTAGFVALIYGLLTGPRGTVMGDKMSLEKATPTQPQLSASAQSPALSMAYLVTGVAGIGFFAFSMVLLGLWPAKVLDRQITETSPEFILPLSPSEKRGQALYAREGCGYCHTQQIRYLDNDMRRFGAPTLAWETQFDSPHLWGTRRVGPDLSREGGVRSQDWHFAHLYDPRSVVPSSIMPSYRSMFAGSALAPKQEARDLVAYIGSLGRARAMAWPDNDKAALGSSALDKWGQMSLNASQLNTHPASQRPLTETNYSNDVNIGSPDLQLWLENCAGCHGELGAGDGTASQWLSPMPANLRAHEYSADYVLSVLVNGKEGTSMPAWRDHSPEDLASLVALVLGLSEPDLDGEADAAMIAQGQKTYVENCVQCHGVSGQGDGFAVDRLAVQATNFRQSRPSLEYAIKVLNEGVGGTPMAPWNDRLSAAEIEAVSHFVRGFFDPQGNAQ
ncbi:MAG: cbb3-type cytochrome c oxidase subunit I [Pseudohongiellaceae bacterium]|nr:cbb3-type cytochrome c oxidase subunit I [Pseudohongiellaceae bacterium]